MSKENKQTLEVYQKTAHIYLENNETHDAMDIEKAKKKKEALETLIKESFKGLEEHAKVLEIGSADGINAAYIQSLGYDVTASDVADDFLKEIRKRNLKTIRFNVLEDDFMEKYYAVFCWRVFVHFTKEDALKIIKKVYDNLEENGIFLFNAINKETKSVEEEWVDFEGEYHMGQKRYYHYFSQEDLDDIIAQTNFHIKDFHKEGGENHNKWLVYTLQKKENH